MKSLLVCILLSFFTVLTFYGCSASSGAEDVNVTYSSKNALMNTDTRIEISGGLLLLTYKSRQPLRDVKRSHPISQNDLRDMYNTLKAMNFTSLKSPESSNRLDSPEEYISTAYDNKSVQITLTGAATIPDNIQQLRTKLFNLTRRYDGVFMDYTDLD